MGEQNFGNNEKSRASNLSIFSETELDMEKVKEVRNCMHPNVVPIFPVTEMDMVVARDTLEEATDDNEVNKQTKKKNGGKQTKVRKTSNNCQLQLF